MKNLQKNEKAKTVYRYYSVHRPVSLGTYPKAKQRPIKIKNFDNRKKVDNGLQAWGYLEYMHPLTDEEASDYELVLAKK